VQLLTFVDLLNRQIVKNDLRKTCNGSDQTKTLGRELSANLGQVAIRESVRENFTRGSGRDQSELSKKRGQEIPTSGEVPIGHQMGGKGLGFLILANGINYVGGIVRSMRLQ